MARRLLAATLTVLAAGCAGGATTDPTATAPAPATTSSTTTTAPRSDPTVTSTTAPSTASTTAPTTTVPAPPPSAASSTSTLRCLPTGDVLSTPSGRRVLLRAGSATAPSASIIVIHGYTGTPEGIEEFAELTTLANDLGIVVAYPEGTTTDDGGFGWATGASVFATDGIDDVAALGELLDVLVATGCVDPARVVLTGESNGGGMALVAACDPALAGRFRRVVAVNAAVDDGVLARCTAGAPVVPLTVVAGRADETVPVEGTDALLPVADWFGVLSTRLAGCTGAPAVAVPLDAIVTRAVGTGCAACSELLVVADGTHTWPGTSRGVSGLDPGTLALNALLVESALSPTTGCLTGES